MNKVVLYYINANRYSVDQLKSLLSSYELLNIGEATKEQNLKEKILSLFLKKKYIGEYIVDNDGKPLSDKCYFNISHSHGFIGIAVTSNNPVGLDIEMIRDYKKSMDDYISSKEEFEYIKKPINFFEIWTSKESLLKAKGTGIKANLKNVPALPINGKKSFENEVYFSKNFMIDDYVISITLKNTDFEVEMREEELKIL